MVTSHLCQRYSTLVVSKGRYRVGLISRVSLSDRYRDVWSSRVVVYGEQKTLSRFLSLFPSLDFLHRVFRVNLWRSTHIFKLRCFTTRCVLGHWTKHETITGKRRLEWVSENPEEIPLSIIKVRPCFILNSTCLCVCILKFLLLELYENSDDPRRSDLVSWPFLKF